MTNTCASWLSLMMASAVAAVATTVVWASQHSAKHQSDEQDDTVRVFMALGSSTQKASGATNHAESPSAECVPCRQKGTEPIAGRVPSRPPPHPTDQDYERITGRSHRFTLPADSGHAPHTTEQIQRGWVMILTGLPIRQTNCFVEVKGDRLYFSRFSGAMRFQQLEYGLSDPAPTLDPEATLLIDSIKTFVHLAASASTGWSRNTAQNEFISNSVTPQNVYLVPTATTWTQATQEDIQVRLQPSGRVAQMEYIRARGHGANLVASRVVLFPEYGAK